MEVASCSWRMVASVGIWWTASTIATIASKSVMKGSDVSNSSRAYSFEDWRWVDLTALQHLLGSILSVMWMKAVGMSVWPVKTHGYRHFIFIAALCNVVGNLATNAAYALIKSSTAHVVKACEPLFAFVLALLLYRNYSALNLSTLLSVMIIVIGAGTFIMGDATYNIQGIFAVMISNAAFPVRNIFLKNLNNIWDNPLQKFAVMSVYSVIFLLPVLLIKLFITRQFLTANLPESLISSVSYSIYNLASIIVLESFSPLTYYYAILNVIRQLFVVLSNIIYFNTSLSWVMSISLIVLLSGCCLYQLKDISTAKYNFLKSILLSCFLTYLIIPTNVFISNRRPIPVICGIENRISTSWVFNKPIPNNIVTNIATLSEHYPDIPIHVYCGTSQCVQQVSKLNNGNIVTEFLVVTRVVKDTPLAIWLAHHPFNKVLARKEFEMHLKEAVKLGILWNYGGYYVDPSLVTKPLSALCKRDNNAFMSKKPNKSDFTFLDVSYFPKNHPFIYDLAEHFVREYPTTVSKNTAFHFNFQEHVHVFSKTCQVCPDIVDDAILEQINITGNEEVQGHFGTFSYDIRVRNVPEANLGNEIQAFPGLQYLPFLDRFIERDSLIAPNGTYNITAFFDTWWGARPPPNTFHPIMLSMQIGKSMQKNVSKHDIEYLKAITPIGCRDDSSINFLKEHGIEAHFSGFFTLLTNNPNINRLRTDNIYLVDVNPRLVKLLPMEIQKKGIPIEHSMKGEERSYSLSRFTAAYKLIEMYGTAKLVITQRIHAALPCVGMGTPVIFINSPDMSGGGGSDREYFPYLTRLYPLFHTLDLNNRSLNEAKEWIGNFSWYNIPLNPNVSILMRLKATAWNVIRQNHVLYDAAKKFGVIPMSLPPVPPQHRNKLLFHLIFTTSNKSTISLFGKRKQKGYFNWRHTRCVEAIFYHHPTAEVIVHSNTLSQRTFDVLTEVGYSITVRNYNLTKLIIDSPAHDFIEKFEKAKRSSHWYSHETDLLRIFFLYKWGGVYLDTDMILVRSLDSLEMNTIGFQDSKKSTLCGAFMMFEKGHSYLKSCLIEFAKRYDGNQWAWNGPNLLTRIWHRIYESKNDVHTKDYKAFYMFHYSKVMSECFNVPSKAVFNEKMSILKTKAYSVHLNSKITGNVGITSESVFRNDTICNHILSSYCILCNSQ